MHVRRQALENGLPKNTIFFPHCQESEARETAYANRPPLNILIWKGLHSSKTQPQKIDAVQISCIRLNYNRWNNKWPERWWRHETQWHWFWSFFIAIFHGENFTRMHLWIKWTRQKNELRESNSRSSFNLTKFYSIYWIENIELKILVLIQCTTR